MKKFNYVILTIMFVLIFVTTNSMADTNASAVTNSNANAAGGSASASGGSASSNATSGDSSAITGDSTSNITMGDIDPTTTSTITMGDIDPETSSSLTMGDVNPTTSSSITQNFEASKRAFPNQGNVQYGVMPGYFGQNNKPGHQFISLDKLMMYNTSWEIKDSYSNISGIKFNYTPHAKKVDKADQSKVIICTKKMFDQSKFEIKILGVGTINSSNKDVISSDLLKDVLYKAHLYGATHIQFLGEGTNTELQSSGWGIGLSYTKASDTSVSTGGTGFSTGWAGYHNLPWQQFFFLKVVDPNAVAEVGVEMTDGTEVDSTTIVDEQVEKAVQDHVTKNQ